LKAYYLRLAEDTRAASEDPRELGSSSGSAGTGRAPGLEKGKLLGIYCVYTGAVMKTQLARWGNSLAVRIPKPVAATARLKAGDELQVEADTHGEVRIRKTTGKPTLADLLSAITPENQHAEWDWGKPQGKELW
jgi:antitoxin MazE